MPAKRSAKRSTKRSAKKSAKKNVFNKADGKAFDRFLLVAWSRAYDGRGWPGTAWASRLMNKWDLMSDAMKKKKYGSLNSAGFDRLVLRAYAEAYDARVGWAVKIRSAWDNKR